MFKNLTMKTFLIGLALGTILSAVVVAGCTSNAENRDRRDSDGATASQGISERESGDSGGEHGGRSEGSGEHGSGGDSGGGENREAASSSPIIPLGDSWNGVSSDWLCPCSTMQQLDLSRNGTKHALTETLLHAGRTPPEVGNEDSGRAWSREARRPEPRTAGNDKPFGCQ